jgi:hypothetical protein
MKRVNALLSRSAPSKQEPSQAVPPTEVRSFVHKRLDDTKSSLRLVTVNSELSADGFIQCYVSHSTLDRASYVCLSYQWGPPRRFVRIHINGAPFFVRPNLFSFLETVRKLPMTFYWIDAICIDQENLAERSHQVAQMGRIFSGAFLVYLWLGSLPEMAPWMQYLRNARSQHLFTPTALDVIGDAHKTVGNCVFNNEYFIRAWVVQEVLLARSVVILLCGESFKLPDLVKTRLNLDNVDLGSFRDCALTRFAHFIDRYGKIPTESLIHLLDEFRDKQCEIPRDRIYSLLSLSSDSHPLEVDYEQTDEDVAYEALTHSDGPLCVCSALLVAQTLRLAEKVDGTGLSLSSSDGNTMLEFELKGLKYARHVMSANDVIQSWAQYKLVGTDIFGHDYLFAHFCPAFELLMDGIQAKATETRRASTPAGADIPHPRVEGPFLLRWMDEDHGQAMLNGFESALAITAHNTTRDACTVSVALELLAELVPQPVKLCSRLVQRKEKVKIRSSEEMATAPEKENPHRRKMSLPRRGTDSKTQLVDLHRIDSANHSKILEDEEPVSRLRLWRTKDRPG